MGALESLEGHIKGSERRRMKKGGPWSGNEECMRSAEERQGARADIQLLNVHKLTQRESLSYRILRYLHNYRLTGLESCAVAIVEELI